jgi:hypothetical protein
MRALFERLRQEGASVVHELVKQRTRESVQLDFKTKVNPSKGELATEDRQYLGPIMSAFSNSSGGLVVLGVEARRDKEDKIDAASLVCPITGLKRFHSDVTSAVGELLMPRHEGVEVIAIEDGADQGFLAIYVERSERRPHRSEAKDDKRYYKRAGDQTFIMEHYDIEDSFRRMSVAKLALVPRALEEVRFAEGDKQQLDFRMHLDLVNLGNVSALFPYLLFSNVKGGKIELYSDAFLEGRVDGALGYSGTSDTVVHPGLFVRVASFKFMLTRWYTREWEHESKRWHESSISFDYSFGCKDAVATNARFELEGVALVNALQRHLR